MRERDNITAARHLRQRMTRTEARLWAAMRDRRLAGLKIRRQHPVGPYVLDFALPDARLGIELDGPVHDGQREEDAARAANLADLGWRLLRFRNDAVRDDLDGVLAAIRRAAIPSPPTPSPAAAGEGRPHGDVGPADDSGSEKAARRRMTPRNDADAPLPSQWERG